MLKAVAQLCGQTVSQFLASTMRHTLPDLVLKENTGVIQAIAAATKRHVSRMLIDAGGQVIPHLLIMHDPQQRRNQSDDPLAYFLRMAALNIQTVPLSQVFRSCRLYLVTNLTIELGDAAPDHSAKARAALHFVEKVLCPELFRKDAGKPSAQFMNQFILGILSNMNEKIVGTGDHCSVEHTNKTVRGLGELIALCGNTISAVSPQVMGLLQKVMEDRRTWSTTLRCWEILIRSMRAADISSSFGQISVLLLRIEPRCNDEQQALLVRIFEYLLVECPIAGDLASLMICGISDASHWQRVAQAVRNRTASMDVWASMRTVGLYLSNENAVVVECALERLRELLAHHGADVHTSVLDERPNPVVRDIVQQLFETTRRYNGISDTIPRLCCECLGTMGAPDPTRVSVVMAAQGDFGPKWDLESMDDAVAFGCLLIEKLLAPSYRSTHSAKMQGFLAYTIQEILSFCGFTSELIKKEDFTAQRAQPQQAVSADELERKDRLLQRWAKFPKALVSTIEPLVSSRYTVKPPLLAPCTYPIYPKSADFRDWIESFALDTFGRTQPSHICRLLSIFANIIKEGEPNTARILLPHAVLNVLLSKDEAHAADILNEVLAVLQNTDASIAAEKDQLCVQTIFGLVDHLTRWIRLKRVFLTSQRNLLARRSKFGGNHAATAAALDDLAVKISSIESWLGQIPQAVMAQASVRCKSYARALMHFEQHVRFLRQTQSLGEMQSTYAELQRIYAQLDEPDGLESITKDLVLLPSIDQQILAHESAARWSEAQTCYEMALQSDPSNTAYRAGLLKCMRHLGHNETMLTHLSGFIEQQPNGAEELYSEGIEAAWRQGRWSLLEQFLGRPHRPGFTASLARLLLAVNGNKDASTVGRLLDQARGEITTSVAAASMESYRRGYDSAIQLSMLHEVEMMHQFIQLAGSADETMGVNSGVHASQLSDILRSWDSRLKITMPSYRVREPILSLRRVLLDKALAVYGERQDTAVMGMIVNQVGRLWLETAKESRKGAHYQTAYGAALRAQELRMPFVFVERAKSLRAQGLIQQAIFELKRGIELVDHGLAGHATLGLGTGGAISLHTDGAMRDGANAATILRKGESQDADRATMGSEVKDVSLDMTTDKFLRSKSRMLLTRWIEETNGQQSSAIIAAYIEIRREQPDWEKSLFHLGRYYNTLRQKELETMETTKGARTIHALIRLHSLTNSCVHQYVRALSHGTKYINQTMPRVLTLWLDFGSTIMQYTPTSEGNRPEDELIAKFTVLNRLMRKASQSLPTYQFLTAIQQLVSRICHKNQNVQTLLDALIVNVLSVYPQQTLWHLMSVNKSTVKSRARRVTSIISKLRADPATRHLAGSGPIETLVNEAQKLTDHLLNLCNYSIPREVQMMSMSKDFRPLQRTAPLSMIIPLQSSMTVTLPASSHTLSTHKPFPNDLPTIEGFHDEIEVMASLQRPRKITIRGSDGGDYIFLCKPADDLRKDSRVMDFNTMINKLIKKDPEARKRGLRIMTYSVMPLNEDCGLIEWVNNTAGYRNIILKGLKAKGITVSTNEIKTILERKSPSLEEIFVNTVLPRFPPVFHEWFREAFPEPSQWLGSRLTYTVSTAVMSMVGYVVGLGDRHGENILFDETTGSCLHVDLNCVFEKGLEFEKPERVPFRLTQNMVDAFGLTGTQGLFRKSCELSLQILQDNRESLMTVLETFLHDPLCEWSKSRRSGPPREDYSEQENERARRILATIERKLSGLHMPAAGGNGAGGSGGGMPLSVPAQVSELIDEATSAKNLSAMYIGWAPTSNQGHAMKKQAVHDRQIIGSIFILLIRCAHTQHQLDAPRASRTRRRASGSSDSAISINAASTAAGASCASFLASAIWRRSTSPPIRSSIA
ncbi:hypothetical protein BC831DRAFT_33247 [Entophlyctis helioformis]|nr:hypothetical protein BC831DRAFT_33247 [Entophlyctis helioformis]